MLGKHGRMQISRPNCQIILVRWEEARKYAYLAQPKMGFVTHFEKHYVMISKLKGLSIGHLWALSCCLEKVSLQEERRQSAKGEGKREWVLSS